MERGEQKVFATNLQDVVEIAQLFRSIISSINPISF